MRCACPNVAHLACCSSRSCRSTATTRPGSPTSRDRHAARYPDPVARSGKRAWAESEAAVHLEIVPLRTASRTRELYVIAAACPWVVGTGRTRSVGAHAKGPGVRSPTTAAGALQPHYKHLLHSLLPCLRLVVHPPVPTSMTTAPSLAWPATSSSITACREGAEMLWPWPMGTWPSCQYTHGFITSLTKHNTWYPCIHARHAVTAANKGRSDRDCNIAAPVPVSIWQCNRRSLLASTAGCDCSATVSSSKPCTHYRCGRTMYEMWGGIPR